MNKIILFPRILLFGVLFGGWVYAELPTRDMQRDIARIITDYAVTTLNVQPGNVHLEILHWPSIPHAEWDQQQIWSVENRSSSADVGHQTLWLLARDGSMLLNEFPVTLKLSVTVNTLVTSDRVKRHTPGNKIPYRIKSQRITRNLAEVVRNPQEIATGVTRHVIPTGKIITRDMIIPEPDILKGDDVKVQVYTGTIKISTDGITTESGRIGDEIKVFCGATRTYLTGVLSDPQTVIIEVQ